MRKLSFTFFLVLISIFAFAGFSFGQDPVKPECPTIGITGPAGLTRPGDTANYSVQVDTNGKDFKLEYLWTISSGEIISGQNTPSITVRFENMGVTATVEIKGLPEGCPNMESEDGGCGLRPEAPVFLDSFPGRITAKEKARFNEIWDQLEANPNARGVIFLAGTVPQIKANKKMIASFITRLRKDPMRVTFIDVYGDEMTEFWLVPSGATEPEPGKNGSQIRISTSTKAEPVEFIRGTENFVIAFPG